MKHDAVTVVCVAVYFPELRRLIPGNRNDDEMDEAGISAEAPDLNPEFSKLSGLGFRV